MDRKHRRRSVTLFLVAGACVLMGGIEFLRRRDAASRMDEVERRELPSHAGRANGTGVHSGAAPADSVPDATSGNQVIPLFTRPRALAEVDADSSAASTRRLSGPPSPVALDRLYDFTSEELVHMARNCEVRFDVPLIATNESGTPVGFVDADKLAGLGLSRGEEEIVSAALDWYRTEYMDVHRRWYISLGGDSSAARTMSYPALSDAIADALGDPTPIQHAARSVAEELVGMRPPPASASTIDAAWVYRRLIALADEFESRLERDFGKRVAMDIRRNRMTGHMRMAGCP